jgi:hypothetical protein
MAFVFTKKRLLQYLITFVANKKLHATQEYIEIADDDGLEDWLRSGEIKKCIIGEILSLGGMSLQELEKLSFHTPVYPGSFGNGIDGSIDRIYQPSNGYRDLFKNQDFSKTGYTPEQFLPVWDRAKQILDSFSLSCSEVVKMQELFDQRELKKLKVYLQKMIENSDKEAV